MKHVLLLSPKPLYDIDGTSNYAYKIVLFLLRFNIKVDFLHYFASKYEQESRIINNENLNILSKTMNLALPQFLDILDENNNYIWKNMEENVNYIHNFNQKYLQQILLHSYDLIIDCTYFQNKSLMAQKNYLFVQQFEPKWYAREIMQKLNLSNPLEFSNNLVLFDHYQLDKYPESKKYFFIPLSSYNENFIKEHSKIILENLKDKLNGDVIYFGRINNHQKNIHFINVLNEEYKANIKEYGPIENNTPTTNYMGKLSRSEIIETVSKAKFSILVSTTEGFSYSLVEAISLGTPIIVRDTYPSAKYLVSYNNGFLIDKNFTIEQTAKYLEKLNKISPDDYRQLVENCIKFALSELNTNKFEERWEDILRYFSVIN